MEEQLRMKLKTFVSIFTAITLVVTASSSFSVFAASPEKCDVGYPIDIYEGTDNAGKYLAFPIDIDTPSGSATAFELIVSCDENAVTLGIDESVAGSDLYDKLLEYGPQVLGDENSSSNMVDYAVSTFEPYRGNYPGAYTNNMSDPNNNGNLHMSWSITDANRIPNLGDGIELYLLYTVKDGYDLSKEEALNKDLIKIELAELCDSGTVTQKSADVTSKKINACAGAFKITVDGSKVPDNCQITAISINGTELSPLKLGGLKDTYEFPVRVLDKGTGSADVAQLPAKPQ